MTEIGIGIIGGGYMGKAHAVAMQAVGAVFETALRPRLEMVCATRPQDTRGFTKVLTGPEHPDYAPFCRGPGHGTGYQDQIIIEARDFLHAIETGVSVWPDFREGLAVHQVIDAAWRSHESRRWCEVDRRSDVGRVP